MAKSKSTRALAKRELERAIGNLDWVEEHLKTMYNMGYSEHPELGEQLLLIGQAVTNLKEIINSFKGSF